MALVHEKLYQNLDFTQVNIQKYVDVLIAEIIKVYNVPNSVTFNKDILNTNFDIDTTIPLGLIINELLTNAAKYAFPNGMEGVISVKLRKNKENLKEYYLEILDNGIGMPDNHNEHMGINIVKELSRQLNGNFTIYSDGGVRASVIFKIKEDIPDNEKL
jgi:two-component sensor histidine kinase